jgi:hypothetical protein
LWPSLDGKHEPVPIVGAKPIQLSLGRVGDELVATGLDDAGTVTLLRMSPAGGMIDHHQLAGDVRAIEAIVVGATVLVRRADQTVEAFDAYGESRGRLAPPAGERLDQITARRGVAVAVTSIEGAPSTLHWIDLHDHAGSGAPALAWGKTVRLPVPAERVALSPDHDRVALVSALDTKVLVLKVDDMTQLGMIDGNAMPDTTRALGFTDDNHLVVDRGALEWWTAPVAPPPPLPKYTGSNGSSDDPWAATEPGAPAPKPAVVNQEIQIDNFERRKLRQFAGASRNSEGGVGNGVVVTAGGVVLGVSTHERSRWLGYNDLPNTQLAEVGNELVQIERPQRVVWLDNTLRPVRAFDIPQTRVPGEWVLQPVVAGPHSIVMTTMTNNGMHAKVELVDIDGKVATTQIATIDPNDMGTMGVQNDTLTVQHQTSVARYHLDLQNATATEQAPLADLSQGYVFRLTDPLRTGGVVAFAALAQSDGYHVATYREGKPGAKAALKPSFGPVILGYVFAFDDDGRSYVFTGKQIEIRDRTGKLVDKVATAGLSGTGAVSRDGGIAFIGPNQITGVYHGVQWQASVWQPTSVMFTPDGSQVIVGTRAGLLELDPTTGKRVDAKCGWNFGLFDSPPMSREFGETPVCVE